MLGKISMLIYVLSFSLFSFAQQGVVLKQKKKAEHKLNLSYTPQWYPNAEKVKFSGYDHGIGQVLYPKHNQAGHNWGLEYQFTSKKGIILSLGMQNGVQNQQVGVHFNMGYVDPSQPVYEKIRVDTSYGAKMGYYTFRVMGGYRWRAPFAFDPKWDMEVKAGATLKYYKAVKYDAIRWLTMALVDSAIFIRDGGMQEVQFGSKSPLGPSRNYTAECYIGFSRNLDLLFIKSLSVGIEATYAIRGGSSSLSEWIYQLPDNSGVPHNWATYDYFSKDFALGIRIALGLGYRRGR